MSSLFSEAFSENVTQTERSCDGRRWGWVLSDVKQREKEMEGGGDAGHQAPPHHLMDQVKLSCLSMVSHMTNCYSLIFLSDPDTVWPARSSSSAGSRPLPSGEFLKTVCYRFGGIYLPCRRLTLQSYTSKLPASRICWSCSMLAKQGSTTQETWRPLPMLGLLRTSQRAAATIMST